MRRSSLGASGRSAQTLLRSPYRCRDCGEKFRVIGRRIYERAAVFVALNVAVILFVAGFVSLIGN